MVWRGWPSLCHVSAASGQSRVSLCEMGREPVPTSQPCSGCKALWPPHVAGQLLPSVSMGPAPGSSLSLAAASEGSCMPPGRVGEGFCPHAGSLSLSPPGCICSCQPGRLGAACPQLQQGASGPQACTRRPHWHRTHHEEGDHRPCYHGGGCGWRFLGLTNPRWLGSPPPRVTPGPRGSRQLHVLKQSQPY